MFCASCGSKLEATSKSFDINTSNKLSSEIYNEPVKTAEPGEASVESKIITDKKPSFRIKQLVNIVLLLAIVVGAVTYAIVYFVNRDNVKIIINDYVDAIYLGDVDALEELYPEAYEDEVDNEIKSYNYTSVGLFRRRSTKMDNRFGDDIVISFDINDIKYVSSSVVDLYSDFIESRYGYMDIDIKSAYRVRFDVEIEGDDDTAKYSEKMLAVKIDGQWCLFDLNRNAFAYSNAYVEVLELDFNN